MLLRVREILDREARYFEKHAKRMRYQEFREKGYQIMSRTESVVNMLLLKDVAEVLGDVQTKVSMPNWN